MKDHKLDAGAYYYGEIQDSVSRYFDRTFGLNSAIHSVINQQIYLDRDLVFRHSLNINTAEDSVSGYLKRTFTEINEVYPEYKLSSKSADDKFARAFLNGYNPDRSGDIFINFKPYYIEETMEGTEHGSPYSYDRHVPLVWYGWKVKSGSTYSYYPVKSISSTIAGILNIDVTEKAEYKPILELLKIIKE